MKKTSLLLLACFAFAASMTALPWPDEYEFTGGIYGATPDVPADYEKQEGVAASLLGEDLTLPDAGDGAAFDAIYDMIGAEFEGELGKLREGMDKQSYDGVPTFKAAYTEEALYLFVKYAHADDSEISDGTNLEVMFCPYDKLEADGVDADKEGYLWLRYLELGGVKVNALNKGSISTFKLGNYMGAVQQLGGLGVIQEDAALAGSRYGSLVELASCGTSTVTKLVLRLDFEALKCSTPLLDDEIPFTLDSWRAACEGKGISFEAKLTLDNGNERDAKRSYMWNHSNNNSYFNNAYAGYLKPQAPPVIVVSAISVTNGVASDGTSYVTEAKEGATVSLISEERSQDGFLFVEWTSESQEDLALLESATSSVTTFVMPAHAVAFTATYWDSISTDGAAIKNMSILDNQIILGEAADVQIISLASGIVVLQVSDATSVPLSGLPAGIYTAKSGSEVIKFAK